MTAAQKERQWTRIIGHGNDLLSIFPNATEREPDELCKKLRRLERKANLIALRLCNGPEFPGGYDQVDRMCERIIAAVNKLLGNVREYQPKTGARCSCRPGVQRDNCPNCEATGYVIDFAAIRARRNAPPLIPIFLNRDPRGYALKIQDEWMREHHCKLYQDWGGYGILAPEIDGNE